MGFTSESESAPRIIDGLPAEGGAGRRRRRRPRPEIAAEDAFFPAVQSGSPASEDSPDAVEVIRASSWSAGGWAPNWLVHGFSTRMGGRTKVYRPGAKRGGDLNLGLTGSDDPAIVAANRKLFLQAVCPGLTLVTLRQIHSSLIRQVRVRDLPAPEACASSAEEARALPGDGLMTDEPGLLLGIQTADCIPILLADRRRRAVAALHAGWRGTLQRIAENGVGRMRMSFGSRPEDLAAAIGPGIGQCCYAVGREVRQQFESQFAYAADLFREVDDSDPVREKYPMLFLTARPPGHSDLGPYLHLDLAEANRRQLLAAGLSPAAIEVIGHCTSCHTERFFSHRGEHGFTGRMMSVIGIARRPG